MALYNKNYRLAASTPDPVKEPDVEDSEEKIMPVSAVASAPNLGKEVDRENDGGIYSVIVMVYHVQEVKSQRMGASTAAFQTALEPWRGAELVLSPVRGPGVTSARVVTNRD